MEITKYRKYQENLDDLQRHFGSILTDVQWRTPIGCPNRTLCVRQHLDHLRLHLTMSLNRFFSSPVWIWMKITKYQRQHRIFRDLQLHFDDRSMSFSCTSMSHSREKSWILFEFGWKLENARDSVWFFVSFSYISTTFRYIARCHPREKSRILCKLLWKS